MSTRNRLVAAVTGALAFISTPAAAQVIDFEGLPNSSGTTIVTNGVTFTNGNGGILQVVNFGAQSNGQALGAFGDGDQGYVVGDLSFLSDAITLSFGNDDPSFTAAGDLAALRVFLGGVQVGATTVLLNRDDIMNQTIGLSGITFDRFTFAYTNPNGGLNTGGIGGLTEIVDNIVLRQVAAVPEPGTWAMMIFGFGAMGVAMRRRRTLSALPQMA